MASPSVAINRVEFGQTFEEFSLEMDRRQFAGVRIFKPRMVGRQSGQLARVKLEALLQRRDTNRAPHGSYSRSDFEFDVVTYSCAEHGVEEPLDDRLVKQYRDLLDAESVHAARAVDAIARAFEIACATAAYDPAVWTGADLTTAVGTAWDAEGGDPVADVEAARKKIIAGSGLTPNVLLLNRAQFYVLKHCDRVEDLLKYSGHENPATVTPKAIAACMDLDEIVVAGGHENTANEAADASIQPIWSDSYCLLARVATGEDLLEPCFGRALCWQEENIGNDGTELGVIVEEYRSEEVRGSVFRARADWDVRILYPEAAHLISGILTPE